MRQAVVVLAGAGLALGSCLVSIGDVTNAGPDASAGAAGGAGAEHDGSGGVAGGSPADASGGAAGTDTGPDVVLPEGLLGYWPFDDGSGSVAKDVTATGRNGVVPSAGVLWTTDAVSGGALSFQAPEDGVKMPGWNAAAFPQVGTITLWLKGEFTTSELGSRGIFDNYDATRSHLFIRRANNNPTMEIQCALQVPSASYPHAENLPIQPGSWQLVAMGWNALDKSTFCYVHGNRVVDTYTADWSPSQQEFEVGDNLVGVIDDVRLWDHLLDDKELAQLLVDGP